ncbi:MAG: cytochrome c oxidase subunit II [Candidatus Margulisbacteria bacterium]|nr:cytochrome c oxidase subunit II [Candidatus Margulisiibacteriota bacterium]
MDNGNFWFPEAVSTFATNVDTLYSFIMFLSYLFFGIIIAATIYFLVKYRKTPQHRKALKHITHNNLLEITWTVIPLFLLMVIFFWGFKDYLNMNIAPGDSQEIRVTAKKWVWDFYYPDTGLTTSSELTVPVNKPIKLIMSSVDVLHSFFIPNMRVKKDLIPNRYTTVWFEAIKPGKYQIFCTEYCGKDHSNMLATLTVLSESDYQEWVKAGDPNKSLPLDQLGQKLYTDKGCVACHSIDGTTNIGPTWKGLYQSNRTFTSGESHIADDNYLRESMVKPMEEIVEGFQGVMPTFAGSLSDREIDAIIEYIKKIK